MNNKILSKILNVLLLAFLVSLITSYVLKIFNIQNSLAKVYYATITFLTGYFVSRIVGDYFRKKDENFGNTLKLIGYFLSVLISLSFFPELQGSLLTTSVFGGLIVGLALQPVLSNFFAGLLIMASNYVKVGKKVRILSTQIPFTITQMPGYKFFSVESSDTGYKGVIEDVGWFYSILKTDERKLLKIPNSVLITSSILEDVDDEEFIYSLRIEIPLKLKDGYDLEKVEREIKEIIKEYNVIEGPYFNEQSDKNFVFIRMKIKSKTRNWEHEKSEVLKKLLEFKRKIEAN